MKTACFVFVAATVFSTATFAQDLPLNSASAYDWSGFYAGVHAGYGWGTADVTTTFFDPTGAIVIGPGGPIGPTPNSFDMTGWTGGAQLGYNFQAGNVVYGVEADFSKANVSGQFQFDPTRPEAIAGGNIDWTASLRGRVGYAFDSTLLFGTAGLAHASGGGFVDNFFDAAPATDVGTIATDSTGFVVGAGIEQAVSENVSLRAEYLHYDFGTTTGDIQSAAYPTGYRLESQNHSTLNVLRAGVDYRF